jgi:hypothetical protein
LARSTSGLSVGRGAAAASAVTQVAGEHSAGLTATSGGGVSAAAANLSLTHSLDGLPAVHRLPIAAAATTTISIVGAGVVAEVAATRPALSNPRGQSARVCISSRTVQMSRPARSEAAARDPAGAGELLNIIVSDWASLVRLAPSQLSAALASLTTGRVLGELAKVRLVAVVVGPARPPACSLVTCTHSLTHSLGGRARASRDSSRIMIGRRRHRPLPTWPALLIFGHLTIALLSISTSSESAAAAADDDDEQAPRAVRDLSWIHFQILDFSKSRPAKPISWPASQPVGRPAGQQ